MNKLKFILTVGIAAVLAMSCSTNDDGNESLSSSSESQAGGNPGRTSSSSRNDGTISSSSSYIEETWEVQGTVDLGGISNATLGSFLDIDQDPFKVYKASEAAANKNKIDLIFDGFNFLTAEGCDDIASTLCDKMAGYDYDYVSIMLDISNVSAITASSSPTDIENWARSISDDQAFDLMTSATTAKTSTKLLILTYPQGAEFNTGNTALVTVDSKDGATTVKLSVSRSHFNDY